MASEVWTSQQHVKPSLWVVVFFGALQKLMVHFGVGAGQWGSTPVRFKEQKLVTLS